MSRFPRLRRRPDHFGSAHERARLRASERLDGPLGLAESTWLDDHLAACAPCAAVAASYEADRLALRGLRAESPEPPRDLWARTAAAIEQEAGRGGRRAASATPPAARRIPLGALSGVAVIAVVVGATVLSNGISSPGATGSTAQDVTPESYGLLDGGAADGGGAEAASGAARAMATPFAVGAGEVQWVRAQGDGSLAYNVADVDEVCPAEAKEGCATLSEAAGSRFQVAAEPESIIGSPDDETAVVVSRDATGDQQLIVVDLRDQAQVTQASEPPAIEPPASEPPASAAASPSAGPTGSPAPATESAGPAPTPTATSTDEPTGNDTSASEDPASSDPASLEPDSSSEPYGGAATLDPTPAASADGTHVTPSPEPTVAARLAIASDIEVVGQSAAFSSDGTWFAFTGQRTDGAGPNVFVWHVGDERANQLTDDDRSVFASWADGSLIVSRPAADAGEQPTAATNTLIDPTTGVQTSGPGAWRPVLDPTRSLAVAWAGTILPDEDGMWRPAEGRLVLQTWTPDASGAAEERAVLSDGPVAEFDVRWDETGSWFAVWIADAADPGIGQLDLYRVDPATGAVDQPSGAPDGVRALPGFSIGDGRLAWATPPGQEGEGSRLQIVAWNGEGVGTVETEPGEDVVVIR